jgi:hypothetical protein
MQTTENLIEESTTENLSYSSSENKFAMNEDWVVVILGFLIIGVTIFGFILPVPSFGWKNSEELISKVFAAKNLGIIGLQFLYVFVVAMIGVLLTGKPVRSSIIVFPVVYILTILALIIAGNATMNGLNLEAVIFSLTIGLLIGNLFRLPDWFRAALSTE